jgi:N-acetylglucosamine kinase-like BadF-type ATPase
MVKAAADAIVVPALGLGLDAGGTQTRWAVADRTGSLLGQGSVGSMSGLQLGSTAGLQSLRKTLQALAEAVTPLAGTTPLALYAGMTGLGDARLEQTMAELMQSVLPLIPGHVHLRSDMDVAYRAAFGPGQGYLLYAGTGSIGAYIDTSERFFRVGGYGPVLGDEGGGYWIAREAMAQLWRNEDQQPGSWERSDMAQRIFKVVGGSDWAYSRQFFYGQDRGTIGKLALQVAAAADAEPAAQNLLLRAGAELAALANHLRSRFGPRPVVLAGRVWQLSPLIEQGLREALSAGTQVRGPIELNAHCAAACRAAGAELNG